MRRAMKGVAAMVSGTMAALVPIEVPAIRRVNGNDRDDQDDERRRAGRVDDRRPGRG